MRLTALLATGAGALVLAGTALAAPDGPRARLDPAASVSRADTAAMMTKRFDRIDTNKDGMIDAAEMTAHRDQMRERWAERRAERRATRMADREKVAAPAGEAATDAAATARREALAKFAKARSEAGKARAQLGFAMRDADGDGRISRDEFAAPALKRFDRADANSDGILTPEERAAMREARRAKRG